VRKTYWRHSSVYKRQRMTVKENAIAHHILLVAGFVYCQRCENGWLDTTIDAMEQQLGAPAVWRGEAALALCPCCVLVEQLFAVLTHRLTALQMEENRQLKLFPDEIGYTLT
jgi:hypothetical protein